MAGKFVEKKFKDIDLNDEFFNSLKNDYPGTKNSTGFIEWFNKKAKAAETALVFEDKQGIQAFIALKGEEEAISLQDTILPALKRMKISTFRISEKYNRERIGEGAIGLILWQWQRSDCLEIYLTVFPKYNVLISLFERFGFQKRGRNLDGEIILIKNRMLIDFSSPYTAFPFIKGHFDYAGYIIIDDNYHDTMFAYSELANVKALETKIESNVINGLSKVYVGKSYSQRYKIGEPVFIYRRYTHGEGKRYHSCITSYCVVTDLYQAKRNNQYLIPFEELKERIGNKSIFNEAELLDQYNNYKNMTVVEMLYYGYFGAGHNVNMDWLEKNGYWSKPNQYPTEVCLTEEQFKRILMEGNINVSNVIID